MVGKGSFVTIQGLKSDQGKKFNGGYGIVLSDDGIVVDDNNNNDVVTTTTTRYPVQMITLLQQQREMIWPAA